MTCSHRWGLIINSNAAAVNTAVLWGAVMCREPTHRHWLTPSVWVWIMFSSSSSSLKAYMLFFAQVRNAWDWQGTGFACVPVFDFEVHDKYVYYFIDFINMYNSAYINTEEKAWLLCSPVLFHPKMDIAYMSLSYITSNDTQNWRGCTVFK